MSWWRRLRRRWGGAGVARFESVERDIRAEMQIHIEMRVADNLAAGMPAAAARHDAEARFGNVERIVRLGREARLSDSRQSPLGRFPARAPESPGVNLMHDLISDLKFAARALIKNPGFAAVAILSLALGIGFNTTMFTVIDAVLFKPLSVEDPDSLVRLRAVRSTDAGLLDSIGGMFLSYPDYLDVRERAESFATVAVFRNEMTTFNNGGAAEFLFGESVSANYFDTLGVRPLIGRAFASGEDTKPDGDFVVMVSESLWRGRLGADPGVLGESLLFAGHPFTLIGVVPDTYRGGTPPVAADFWLPATMTDLLTPAATMSRLERRSSRSFSTVARLRPGVTLEQAHAEVQSIGRGLAEEYPDSNGDRELLALAASDVRFDPVVDSMMLPVAGVLMAIVGLILLIACANVANMMLARASARRQEIAVRLALGAGRGRLIRQLLTESVLLAACGGLLAVVVAAWTLRMLSAIQPPIGVPISLNIPVDPRVLIFTGLVSLATGVLFGLVPALQSTRADLTHALKGDDARSTGGHSGRLRNSLVVVQVAVSMVLLIGASLLVRSLSNASAIDPGIATESIVGINMGLAFQGYDADKAKRFHTEFLERIEALPGVDAVAFAERMPLESTTMITRNVWVEGRSLDLDEDVPEVVSAAVSAGYFGVLGITMRSGRVFSAADRDGAPGVAIINEVMAEEFWPGENPLGKRLAIAEEGPWFEVVGVNSPHKISTLGEDPTAHMYVSYEQVPAFGFSTILARTGADDAATIEGMRRAALDIDPALAIMQAKTIGQHMSLSLFPVRLAAAALGGLGALGALLAAVGVYGVVAFSVVRRTHEIGIRIAVGADPRRVIRLVLRQGMRLVGIGAVIGVGISLATTRALEAMLYGVGSMDPIAFVGAAAALAGVAVLANLVPALRAARVDPIAALRSE